MEVLDQIEDPTAQRLYPKNAIYAATFLGGPIAGAILMNYNLKQKGSHKLGTQIMVGCSVLFVVVMCLTFLLPIEVSDNIPGILYTAIYMGAVAIMMEKFINRDLLEHAEQSGLFFSAWRGAGIGLLCLLCFVVVIALFFVIGFGGM